MPTAKNKNLPKVKSIKRTPIGSPSASAKPAKKSVKNNNRAELEKLTAALNKKFGDNCITVGVAKDSTGAPKAIERIKTGSIALDVALGGGIPKGRCTEISGIFSSTKTTQTLHIIRIAQEMGLTCALVDVEGTTDESYLRSIGVDYDSLLYTRPDGMEEACQLILDMQRSKLVDLCVLDSIAALSPNKEQETSMEDTIRMGIPQQIFGEFTRKYQANNNRLTREGNSPFTLICINQLREKIGGYGD